MLESRSLSTSVFLFMHLQAVFENYSSFCSSLVNSTGHSISMEFLKRKTVEPQIAQADIK